MMYPMLKRSLLFSLILVALAGCKKDEDPGPTPSTVNESELITTVILKFTDPELSESFELRWRDLDGDGGNAPVITTVPLPSGRAFNLSVRLLDESVSPAEELTGEIQGEANEHQFFFDVQNADLSISYADQDGNGKPLGLLNLAISGGASTGSVKVTLRHDPDKAAVGVSVGDITNAGGDTDIEVVFPLVLE